MIFKSVQSRQLGLIVTIVSGFFILVVFYQGPLLNPNTTFFAAGGDGLKDYYNTVYYVTHDSTVFHSKSMNYPHGEHIFYTGNQPSISFILKFIHNDIADISDKIVGILNLTMLISLILGAVFLYLLFVHFKLPVFYSVIISIGITFLSPQLARMPGHFSLSYVFAIPAMLYLIAKFDQRNRYYISIIIGLFILWALGTHIYMLGFHASIVVFYWFWKFAFVNGSIKSKENYFHLALQFIIPLAVFFSINLLTDHITDRTAYPWGFLYYRAYPESIFLPIGKSYGQFLYQFSNFKHIDWEGFAYVGLTATLGFFTAVVLFFKYLFQLKINRILNPAENNILNIFFWASFFTLLYSFGLPFIIGGLDRLVHYIGPLKQMRGIARFSWLFFYVINIYVFYHIWNLKDRGLNKYIWYALVITATTFLYYDAYLNVKFWSKFVDNRIPALTDHKNETEENQWYHMIDSRDYQAAIPIPYFHIGSENTWIEAECGITKPTYIVSWKTGLPTMGVKLSRTSISQSYENIELFIEPYRRPAILDKLIPGKSFLIITRDDCTNIPQIQQKLIDSSIALYQSTEFSLYECPWDSLVSVHDNLFYAIFSELNKKDLFEHGSYLSDHTVMNFQIENFSENPGDNYYLLPGSFTGKLRKGNWIYHKDIPEMKIDEDYIISFWVNGLHKDLFMRSHLELQLRDSLNHGHDEWRSQLFRIAKVFDGDWVLIEMNFSFKNSGDMIRWRITNNDLRKSDYTVNHVLVRPAHTNIYRKENGWFMKNNRFYIP
ncbi:MAG: hypothetical protein EA393_06660 [Bacteroidetes bacterium]|nr:MAG: hypothetical protein EA393_06660 [Bacteroidota bacterium]